MTWKNPCFWKYLSGFSPPKNLNVMCLVAGARFAERRTGAILWQPAKAWSVPAYRYSNGVVLPVTSWSIAITIYITGTHKLRFSSMVVTPKGDAIDEGLFCVVILNRGFVNFSIGTMLDSNFTRNRMWNGIILILPSAGSAKYNLIRLFCAYLPKSSLCVRRIRIYPMTSSINGEA